MPVDATIRTPVQLRMCKQRGGTDVPWGLTAVTLVSESGDEYWFPFRALLHKDVAEATSTCQKPLDYIIKVQTAKDLSAGTDLAVFVRLKGQHAATVNIPLNQERSVLPGESGEGNILPDMKALKDGMTSLMTDKATDLFNSGQTDTFKLTLPYLGEIEEVSLAVPPVMFTDEWRVEKVSHINLMRI